MNWCWLNNSTNVATYTFTPTLLFCLLLRKESGKEFNSGWGCWEGWLMGLFYTSMLILNILHIAKTEIWLFRTKWGCLGRGKELIYFISLMYYLCQYLISFLETQNDGYWEQDGDACGEGAGGGGKKGISRRARSHGKVFFLVMIRCHGPLVYCFEISIVACK